MTRMVKHSLVAAVLIGTFAFGLGAGMVYAYDSRLDDADASIVKAIALLEAASPGAGTRRQVDEFDRDIRKAIDSLDKARAEIGNAETAIP